MDTSFAPYRDEFLGHISDIVCCTATTVDLCGRPRSRMLHPIWEIINGLPVGWVVTSKTPVKTAHLKENPHMACMYWNPNQHTVSIDTVARWASAQEKPSVWNLFTTTPPPLGMTFQVSARISGTRSCSTRYALIRGGFRCFGPSNSPDWNWFHAPGSAFNQRGLTHQVDPLLKE